MSKLRIFIEELECEFSCDWAASEYPQMGDSISILHICSAEQEKKFEQMPVPSHLNSGGMDFKNAAEFIDYRGFIVKYRMWGREGILTIGCKREED